MQIMIPPFHKAVIDSSPLFTALTLELLEREPQAAISILDKYPLQPYLANDPTSQRNFRALIDSIGEILTTSHVIGEIRSRFHVREYLHSKYWESNLDFFAKHNINEKLVTVAEMIQDLKLKQLVYEVGPIDTGLMQLAHQEGCTLLTDDSNLYTWLGAFPGLSIELVKNLVSYA
ncbi:MAG: hypothetical protein J2P41_04035 [Blastocatellia bacterium]|nr:hypothetical protein [Blastocatellia bacterium]